MSSAKMRPTFLLESEMSSEDVMRRLRASLKQSAEDYVGQLTRNHAMISISESKRHFWSPWMHIEVRDKQPVSEIFGRFSPHPTIWTGIMFSYLSLTVLGFFALIWGVSQQLAGESPWALVFLPAGLLIAGLLWVASQAGQRLADDEMRQMLERMVHWLGAVPLDDA